MLEIHNFTKDEIDEKLFQRVAKITLKILEIENKTEISLAIADSGRMRRLNKRYRNKNQTTDVLSFGSENVLPYLAKAFPRLKRKESQKFIEPPDGTKRLGEIIICYPEAKKQAKQIGHSLEKELTILLIHAILHLVGYEHERGKKEAKEMEETEEKIMDKIQSFK